MNLKPGKILLLLLMLALFSVLGTEKIKQEGKQNTRKEQHISDRNFRAEFFSDNMWENEDSLSKQSRHYLQQVKEEAQYFPVPESVTNKKLTVAYTDAWQKERTYGGKRGHEGTDIMASENTRGLYPVISMTDGVITNLGWLEKGGYRIGITTESGTYYYYAHLDSYGNIQEGDRVEAGTLLGYMGDSGYGPEGTVGKFAVHLHIGVYFYEGDQEISVNPYYLLKKLEKKKLKYKFQ